MLRRLIRLLTVLIVSGFAFATDPVAANEKAASMRVFSATAHSRKGKAANGTLSRRGTVAADSNVLPFGSVIRIRGAGKYSGNYTVIDAGTGVKGQEIDIYMASAHEAKQFGRRQVGVEVIARGRADRPGPLR